MADPTPPDPEEDLPPPGSRWGAGAQSVLPYLTKTLQARPAASSEGRDARVREGVSEREGARQPTA